MKKTLKIAGISLAVLALVSNLYTAVFTFYGIKTHNLAGQVWAQSTSTSTNGTGSSSAIVWSTQTSGCYKFETSIVPVTTYASGGGTASVSLTGNQVTGVNLGGSGTSTATNQYLTIATPGSQVDCPLGFGFCSTKSCSYPPGTKASYVVLNGQQIPVH